MAENTRRFFATLATIQDELKASKQDTQTALQMFKDLSYHASSLDKELRGTADKLRKLEQDHRQGGASILKLQNENVKVKEDLEGVLKQLKARMVELDDAEVCACLCECAGKGERRAGTRIFVGCACVCVGGVGGLLVFSFWRACVAALHASTCVSPCMLAHFQNTECLHKMEGRRSHGS